MSLHSRQSLYLIGILHLFALVYSGPPHTPSRCANARKPANGSVKCGIERGSAFEELAGKSGGGSSSVGSSKGSDIYICTYSCNKGYQLNGSPVLECPISSVIDNPTCEPVECSTLPTVEHASLNCDNGFLYGSQCQYTCVQGFVISDGSTFLTCGSDGLWRGAVPLCEPVQCPPLAEPNHGSLSCSNGRLFGSDCRYTCDDLYGLDGSPILTCSETGTWVGETPKCKRGVCIPLPLLIHGSLSCTRGWDNRSHCVYSCHRGFLLTGGSFILTCMSNGFWRGDIPTCEQDTRSGTTLSPTRRTKSGATTDATTSSSAKPPYFETTTDYTTDSENFTTYVTSGNSSDNFSTNELFDTDGGPANIAAQAPPRGSSDGSGDSGLNTAATVSIAAVAILLAVVGIGLFVAYHKGQRSQEDYAPL